jgi:hypothetical protein
VHDILVWHRDRMMCILVVDVVAFPVWMSGDVCASFVISKQCLRLVGYSLAHTIMSGED